MPNTYYDSSLTGEQIEAALTAIDGVVSQENNGKVLAIENGKIVAKSASEWTDTPVLQPLSVTANGDYVPESGVDGFNSVHVAVPGAGNIQPLSVTENGTYNPPSGVDGYAPVTVNVSGGEQAALYILNPDISDAIGAAGGSYSNSGYACASHAYAPIVAKNHVSTNREDNFWLPYYSTYAGEANKGFYGRKGFDNSLIFFATKIQHGKYSSLHIRFEVTQGSFSSNSLVLYLQPQLEFTSTAPYVQSSLKTQSISDSLVEDHTVDIDVSDIEQDFYIAFFQYNGFTKIRSIYLDNN